MVCDPLLRRVSQGAIPDARDLNLMCNTACTASLDALRKTQLAQCKDTDTITVGDAIYPATYMTDLLLYTYNWACLTDS